MDAFGAGTLYGAAMTAVVAFISGRWYEDMNKRRAWRDESKKLAADVVRAKFLQDDDRLRRAEADQLAHACIEPDPTIIRRLTGRKY